MTTHKTIFKLLFLLFSIIVVFIIIKKKYRETLIVNIHDGTEVTCKGTDIIHPKLSKCISKPTPCVKPVIDNGTVIDNVNNQLNNGIYTYSDKSKIDINCATGYKLSSKSGVRICNKLIKTDGSFKSDWNLAMPVCKVNCNQNQFLHIDDDEKKEFCRQCPKGTYNNVTSHRNTKCTNKTCSSFSQQILQSKNVGSITYNLPKEKTGEYRPKNIGNILDTTYTYLCDPYYEITKNRPLSEKKCTFDNDSLQHDTVSFKNTPACRGKQCPTVNIVNSNPGTINYTNDRRYNKANHLTSKLNYTCKPGYTKGIEPKCVTGNNNNVKWNSIATCVPKTCDVKKVNLFKYPTDLDQQPSTAKVNNVSLTYNNFGMPKTIKYGDSIPYTCGYRSEKKTTNPICKADGTLSITPRCQRRTCTFNPPSEEWYLSNMSYANNTLAGSYMNYGCNPGYEKKNMPLCNNNGTLSRNPSCKLKKCNVTAGAGTTLATNSGLVNSFSNVAYTCATGYTRVGNFSCNSNGDAVHVACTPPPKISHIQTERRFTVNPERVRYEKKILADKNCLYEYSFTSSGHHTRYIYVYVNPFDVDVVQLGGWGYAYVLCGSGHNGNQMLTWHKYLIKGNRNGGATHFWTKIWGNNWFMWRKKGKYAHQHGGSLHSGGSHWQGYKGGEDGGNHILWNQAWTDSSMGINNHDGLVRAAWGGYVTNYSRGGNFRFKIKENLFLGRYGGMPAADGRYMHSPYRLWENFLVRSGWHCELRRGWLINDL